MPWPKGKHRSEETKQKQRLAFSKKRGPLLGKFGADHPAFGTKRSKASRKKISMALRGKPRPLILGEKNPNWKGGIIKDGHGYKLIYVPGHIEAKENGGTHAYEHRKIWADNYGQIPDGMNIHHLDENKENNSIENLVLLKISDHARLHFRR